jgi:hypothetical protein
MEEGPTILLITKDRFWEPTMLMKTNQIALVTHDVTDKKEVDCDGAALRTVASIATVGDI